MKLNLLFFPIRRENKFSQIDYQLSNPRKTTLVFSRIKTFSVILFILCLGFSSIAQNQNIVLDENSNYYVNAQTLGRAPIGGDTIFVKSSRTFPLRFQQIEGDSLNPIVVINKGGQVKIDGVPSNTWGALSFENSKYIKVSGAGHPGYKYGFELAAIDCGLAFSELSSDCEAEFVKISHDGFFGIYAKKDYGGNPPIPYPVFKNLIIHDCFIEGVSEGMYLGETKSPGMEFKHVKIYNNIIRDTQRESIQIANMVEDIEVYNNTMINAGTEAAVYHMNNLQIGGNTVVNAYNNIIMEAPMFGIINMGKGDCSFTNNYVASSKGIFCDNRLLNDTLTPINIKQNYFKSIAGSQVIRNMNELNYFTAEDNKYDTDITFYLDQTGINNETLNNNTLTGVSEIQFTDPANNDYSLAAGTPIEYLSMGASGGPEFFEYEDPATLPSQLNITSAMVIDSVQGGSVRTPLYLFDEQSLDVEGNEHAVSDSWKPDYVMNESAYHTILDLGDEHYISEINLHDMHGAYDFTVEYLDSTLVWNNLFVDPLEGFNVWNKHTTNISTRYLRFSMQEDVFAAVNEITVHGYPLIKESQNIVITPSMVIDSVQGGSVRTPLYLFDEQSLDVEANERAISDSWKPDYVMNESSYHTIVDLGQDYRISEINLHDMHATYNFTVEYLDSDLAWNTLFVDSLSGFNIWKRHASDISTRYLRFSMYDDVFAAVNEIIVSGYPIMTLQSPEDELEPETEPELELESDQIVVLPSMVIDSVQGGSVRTPLYLFDEQSLDVEANERAISDSWKPDYVMNESSYHTIVDLGEEYHISEINLHDMHATHNFTVEYLDSALAWNTLFVDSLSGFNIWKRHTSNISTRYLRFSMYDDVFAAVNEVILYGAATSNSSKQNDNKNSDTQQNKEMNADKVQVFPNPVNETLYLRFPEKMIGSNNIRVTDALGRVVYNKNIIVDEGTLTIELNASQFLSSSGLYFLSIDNNVDYQTIKVFMK